MWKVIFFKVFYFFPCISEKIFSYLYQQNETIMYTINEINEGITEAKKIINRELSFGDLANLNRVSKYTKYIADMNEIKISL